MLLIKEQEERMFVNVMTPSVQRSITLEKLELVWYFCKESRLCFLPVLYKQVHTCILRMYLGYYSIWFGFKQSCLFLSVKQLFLNISKYFQLNLFQTNQIRQPLLWIPQKLLVHEQICVLENYFLDVRIVIQE